MFTHHATSLLAIMILCGLVLLLIGCVVVDARRTRFTWPQYFVYLFGVLMTRIFWRAKVSGRLPIAEGQGAVIVCNHRSPFDPAFIQLATDRVVHWMVAREYCQSRLFGWFLRIPEVIPVGRGGIDTAATRLAIRCAQEGGLVGMLPEGRINMTDQFMLPGRPGAALVALRARVPVVPCYISGSPVAETVLGALVKPAKVRLVVGCTIDISAYYGREKERGVLEELTRRFMTEIADLADVKNFQPELAGKNWKPGDA